MRKFFALDLDIRIFSGDFMLKSGFLQ